MDWKAVIGELKELGYSQPQIATECKCGQSTVSELATGKVQDPRDSLGQALRALLKKARKQAQRAPA